MHALAARYCADAAVAPAFSISVQRVPCRLPVRVCMRSSIHHPSILLRGCLAVWLSAAWLWLLQVTKSVNRNNAEHCVLFEAIHLIIKQGDASEATLRAKAVAHLSKFINIREPNIRYLGLDTMSRLVNLEGTGDAIRRQQATIMFSLKDADISVRRRALDLLFAMCDRSIAESVVRELLSYLAIADWAIKDEMVLKLAILAERFAPDMRWCVCPRLRYRDAVHRLWLSSLSTYTCGPLFPAAPRQSLLILLSLIAARVSACVIVTILPRVSLSIHRWLCIGCAGMWTRSCSCSTSRATSSATTSGTAWCRS